MPIDPSDVNEELKKARETAATAEVKLLMLELNRKVAFEDARNKAACTKVDGKPPTEAACERAAKSDPTYLKLCDEEIEAKARVLTADIQVEYLRHKLAIALK